MAPARLGFATFTPKQTEPPQQNCMYSISCVDAAPLPTVQSRQSSSDEQTMVWTARPHHRAYLSLSNLNQPARFVKSQARIKRLHCKSRSLPEGAKRPPRGSALTKFLLSFRVFWRQRTALLLRSETFARRTRIELGTVRRCRSAAINAHLSCNGHGFIYAQLDDRPAATVTIAGGEHAQRRPRSKFLGRGTYFATTVVTETAAPVTSKLPGSNLQPPENFIG